MIDCISISSWYESWSAAAATFSSTNKIEVVLRGGQNLVVLGFSYKLVRSFSIQRLHPDHIVYTI